MKLTVIRYLIRNLVSLARRHVEWGRLNIARQQQYLNELRESGRDTEAAQRLFERMAKQSTRSAILVLRVRPELKAALERLAANERRSISNYVEIILEDHVQKPPSRRR
jgi:hypothetical protein